MFFLFFFTLGVYQYTIDEHHDKLVQILHKDLIHQIHKVGWAFSRSRRHYCILIQTTPQKLALAQIGVSHLKIDLREHTHHRVDEIDHQS
jgi:hypothetical protein